MPLHITEYQRLAHDASGHVVPTGHEPARRRQVVSIGVSQADAQPTEGSFVRLHATEACLVNFARAAAGNAVDGHRMPAGGVEFFGVDVGTVISVIATA